MKSAVIIVNYNSSALLKRCIAALAKQTVTPTKIIVVDNASDEAASIQQLEILGNDDINVLLLNENIGYGGAINRALAGIPDYTYACCLNPDAFPEPTWLENLINVAERHPVAGSVASLMLKDDDTAIIDGAGDALSLSGFPWRRYASRPLSRVTLVEEYVFSACAGACLYRVSAVRKVGGFDESMFMYLEDIDLGFRLQLAGFRCVFTPTARVRHIGSAITGFRSGFSTFYGHRNTTWVLVKNMPAALLPAACVAHVFVSVLLTVVMARTGRLRPYTSAKFFGLLLFWRAYRERKNILRLTPTLTILKSLSSVMRR